MQKKHTRFARSAAVAVVALTIGACASAGAAGMDGGMGANGTGGMSGSMAMGQGGDFFADANIAAVGSASNQDEIETSRVALQKTQNQAVRQFAQMMVDQHTAVEGEMQQMLRAKGMAPQDNALSAQMKRNLAVTLTQLRGASGADFDMMYILHQIHAHDMTLKTLDTSLIPGADDPQMKAFLQNRVRPAVADHLQRAMAIHHQMGMQH